ncbi:glycosyltransferase family 2 protein [Microbacterium telephonicum]|uniref:Glycosyl transferase family 2 n=1 Tax=Microbacterium telephonicum TaxID=1714841 RepID=A0A498C5R0_9MICO|nr:glycosyltransferase family 2 protein [Microbacterium telephonicum]RLK47751.1 glycosyl transferase family 2 [Microbacterium telephonicum]
MTLVMTVMVRDEADIIAAMVEYHLASGVDVLLITDNGSVDGTREILAEYEGDPRVFVVDDPVQDKNQAAKVTAMARRAATDFGADWVINADADEFFVPKDRSLTLGELFSQMPKSIVSATIPVVDMTGAPGRDGTGLARLLHRDERDEFTLYGRSGLHAHATHDAIHIGDPNVVVAQGNHYVSLASNGPVPTGLELESLHFPWRSFRQFERKVRNAGVAYEANPRIRPSPRHHGMRDYRFLRAGALEESYVFRHPLATELGNAELPRDEWLSHRLRDLAAEQTTRSPERLLVSLRSGPPDYDDADVERARAVLVPLLAVEDERVAAEHRARDLEKLSVELETSRGELAACREALEDAVGQLQRIRAGRMHRWAHQARRLVSSHAS